MKPRPRFNNLLWASSSLLYVFFAICVRGQDQQSNGNKSTPPPLVSPPPAPSPILPPPRFTPPPLLHPHPPPPRKPPPGPLHYPPPPPPHHPPPRLHRENHPNLVSSDNRADGRKQDVNINLGKKIGLLFIGIAVILQVVVVGFLAFKRRQLLMMRD